MEDSKKTTSKKSSYTSMNEWIARMKITFENAKQPAILAALQTVGYTEARLDALLDDVATLEGLCETQKMEYAEQNAETQKFEQKKEAINATYLTHRGMAKILFKSNLQAQVALNLGTPTKTAYAEWLRLVSNFYSQLSKSAELNAEVAKIGIDQTVIDTALAAIAELTSIKDTQKKETAEAQASTETRDIAFDALYEQYTELMGYAKALLKGDQMLEALGVVVKR